MPARGASRAVRRILRRAAIVAATVVTLTGCHGPGDVRFDHDGCYIDGRAAGLAQVQEREALVGHRIAARQPWLIAITVVVVSLAGVSYVERLALLFSASRGAPSLGDRIKALVDRYRAHPVRYFALVGGSVGLLFLAGGLYIYFDADKRSSERALATLQFCHLALRTGDEKKALDDQRRNLASLHETAGAIRQLIDKLPPAEQAKAEEIVSHMDDAVGRQGRLIADHLKKSEDTAQAIRDGTLSIARDLTGLEGQIATLHDLPAGLRAVADEVQGVAAHSAISDRSLVDLGTKLVTIQRSVDELIDRPAPSCPSCVCTARTGASGGPRVDGSAN